MCLLQFLSTLSGEKRVVLKIPGRCHLMATASAMCAILTLTQLQCAAEFDVTQYRRFNQESRCFSIVFLKSIGVCVCVCQTKTQNGGGALGGHCPRSILITILILLDFMTQRMYFKGDPERYLTQAGMIQSDGSLKLNSCKRWGICF